MYDCVTDGYRGPRRGSEGVPQSRYRGQQAQCVAKDIHLHQLLAINNMNNGILAIIVHLADLTSAHGTGGAPEFNCGTLEQPTTAWANRAPCTAHHQNTERPVFFKQNISYSLRLTIFCVPFETTFQ